MTKIMHVHCTICGCNLTGGLDTFGDWDAPLCWTCWSSAMALDVPAEDLASSEITAAIWAADAEDREP